MNKQWVDTSDIKNILTHGDVDFDKSNKPFEGGKLYTIEGKNKKNEEIILEVINYSDRAVLKNIIKDRVFFRHWVKFNPIIENPSKQQTGSFNPTYDEWFIDLYM
jgi:hypothetical protein